MKFAESSDLRAVRLFCDGGLHCDVGPTRWADALQYCEGEFVLQRLRRLTQAVELDVMVLWLAARDPRTPWPARLLAGLAAAYVLSPIQLIPNFIPVLGYLDDLVVVTLAGKLALKIIPAGLIEELRAKAQAIDGRPTSRTTALVIILLWIGLTALVGAIVWRFWHAPAHGHDRRQG